MKTPPVDGAFEQLRRLSAKKFGEHIHLVSKCGVKTEEKTKEWLAAHRFFEETGVPPTHLHFCRTRPEKAPICERLGVTAFIDDREDVLDCLKTVETRILFRTQTSRKADFTSLPSWAAAAEFLLHA